MESIDRIFRFDFASEGQYVAVSTSEDCIHLIDALAGERKKKIKMKDIGVGVMKYTHHDQCLLVSAKQSSTDVKYLSLHDNKYLRTFQGHQGLVSSISVCPLDDNFLTASVDNTVLRWDLSTRNEVARIKLPPSVGTPLVNYDSSGLVFGVLTPNLMNGQIQNHSIRLFDSRRLDGGPFQVISPTLQSYSSVLDERFPELDPESKQRALNSNWTSFQFSSDGNSILINTDGEYAWILDGFRPDVPPKVVGPRKNDGGVPLAAYMSTDCKQILLANAENEIQLFDAESLEMMTTLSGHLSNVGCIACNPRYDMFVSGCVNTALWIPKV